MHFFNPAPVQGLVEVVRTVVTEPDVLEDVTALVRAVGKNPVVCGDKAGFIANTLLFGYLNHAVAMYEGQYASREDIDAAMRFGCGYPMGPLALLDLIGLDTAYEILETMYRQGRDRLHAPAPILKQMVTAGMLGRKSGRGFYTYEEPGQPGRGRRREDAVGRRQARSCATTSPRSASSAPARWPPGSSRCSPRPGTTCVYVGRSQDKVGGGPRRRSSARWTRRSSAASWRSRRRARCSRRLTGTTKLDDLADVDLVVEAIAEDLKVKTTLFENLDEICKQGAILATTTSSLPVIACAQATKRPGDVIGMHFFNPAPVMKLVEVVSTVSTARGRRRDHAGTVRGDRQGRRSPAATAPASSSTRCCSPTSTTRSRCSRRTTRPPTTSTPR